MLHTCALVLHQLMSGMVQLEGGGEGEEPLAAYETSLLSFSGNSSVRASWDERLGFRKGRAICSFRSLRPEGGLVPFIDVIVTNTYTVGYKGPFEEGRPADYWDEKEEIERQRAYEVGGQKGAIVLD